MNNADKIKKCKGLLSSAFNGLDRLTISGVSGCAIIASVADCLSGAYKIMEELEQEPETEDENAEDTEDNGK